MALNEKWGELFGNDSPSSGTSMALASADAPGGWRDNGAPDLKASGGPGLRPPASPTRCTPPLPPR